MYEEEKRSFLKHLDFIILDVIILHIDLLLAYILKCSGEWNYQGSIYLQLGGMLGIFSIVVALFAQSYRGILRRNCLDEFKATITHISLVVILCIIFFYLIHSVEKISRVFILYFWIIGSGLCYCSRIILKYFVRKIMKDSKDDRVMVLISAKNLVEETIRAFKAVEYRNYHISQIILVDDSIDSNKEILGVPAMNYSEESLYCLRTNVVDEVFINVPSYLNVPNHLLDECYKMGITVHMNLMTKPYGEGSKIVERLAGYDVLTSGMKIATPIEVLIKRSIDIIGGLVGTFITGFLTLMIGPIIYLKDPGPIFFSQTRIGKNGRKFKIYKFRSMYMNAEERKKELMDQNELSGPMFKMEHDPRIIPGIGEKIREWSLDEFPQFINVLKGDMSLVGTRPPTVDEWEKYESHHRRRMAIKPGITGMWQVSGRSDIKDFEDVVKLDSQYITEWSIALDIKILLKTVLIVFKRSGSR